MSFLPQIKNPGIHEQRIRSFFNEQVYFEGSAIFDEPLYVIAFFNRSGSNLLAEYLRNTPYFSGFFEQLNFDAVINYSEKNNIQCFPDLITHQNETFKQSKVSHGYKASIDQLMMLIRFGIPKMFKGGLRIIHIYRNDIIGQAISYQIALQTKQWTSNMKSSLPDEEIKFDPIQLSKIIDAISASNNSIGIFSEIYNAPLLNFSYEEILEDPQRALDRVAEFSGNPACWSIVNPKIQKQASDINNIFRKKYIDYLRTEVQ